MPQDEGINLFLFQRKNSIHDTYFKELVKTKKDFAKTESTSSKRLEFGRFRQLFR